MSTYIIAILLYMKLRPPGNPAHPIPINTPSFSLDTISYCNRYYNFLYFSDRDCARHDIYFTFICKLLVYTSYIPLL